MRNLGARKFVPFGTIGVSLAALCDSGCEGGGGYNFGGGFNYWFKPNRGLRAEFRDHLLVYDAFDNSHKWELRLGFAF